MRNLTCIVCPVGCALEADYSETRLAEKLSVTGNKCPRGEAYAREEILAPKRVVTATVKIAGNENISVRRIPVKSSQPCPREKIPALLEEIYKLKVTLPVRTGDILIKNWNGEGIDIVATRTINEKEAL